jgi:aminopeptidase N/puromycin-sensitive aminopeptidase
MKKALLLLIASLLLAIPSLAQRLPGGATPDHYSLSFAINFPTNSFEGDETIDLKLDKPSTTITLNAVEIDFHQVSVSAGGKTQTAKVVLDEKNETATFTVENPIPAGVANVHITYTGHLNDKLRGLYLSTFNGRKYAVTQMEAVDARAAFPSFDEPADKATFDITAIVDEGDTAISNNEIVSDKPGPGKQHTIKFATSPKMSSYLVALAVGDWKCAHDSVDGIKLGVCTVPGKENLTHFPLEATKAIMHYYGEYYGIKYPLAKLDQIAVPDFQAGAMENWGAIIYRETALLIDEKTASVGARKGVTGVIAHEVAHQWFGDLVTMQWWDDVWLNEGFATWMTPHPMAAWKPEWLVGQDVAERTLESLAVDGTQNTRPIHQAAEARTEIESLFDGIAYGKTASVLRMLEAYLGPEVFRAGVNLYLKEHAYGNATAADFWSAMARSSKKPVDKIMPTFVMQAGEPYLQVSTRCADGNTDLTVAQKRYFNTPEAFKQPNNQSWQIPICVKGVGKATGSSECVLLTSAQQEFKVKGCPTFTYPNAGAAGYYRYDYNARALNSLGAAAEQGLSPEERISLVGNEWALMRAGLAPVGDYLSLGEQFKNTPGSVLLGNYFDHLEFVEQEMVEPADKPAFRAWLTTSFSPILKQLGYAGRPTDTPADKQKRANLIYMLGDVANDPQVIAESKEIVQKYMNDPTSADGTLIRAAMRVSAMHGDAALYDQFKAQMKKKLSPEAYYLYFYGLAWFPGDNLGQTTLDWALTPEVRNQDLFILGTLVQNPATRGLAWNYIQTHYDAINSKAGGGLGGAGVLLSAVSPLCDEKSYGELQEFFQQHPTLGTSRNQKEALETVKSCIALRTQQQPQLSAWLQKNSSQKSSSAGAAGIR